jgi:hypothetical protein
MSNSTEKENWWMYIILIFIGILSLPLGILSIAFLSGILIGLQNILCEFGWCGIDLFWASQFILPFLMCSILVSLVMYHFKKSSIALALKVLVISFAIICSLFFVVLSFSNFSQLPIHPFFILLLILLITVLAGFITFKERPIIGFAIRAFSISFVVVILAIIAWFFLSMGQSGMFMIIEEVNIAAGENVRFVEITQEELDKYPPLKKAMNAYAESNSSEFKVDFEEQRNVSDFINKKRSRFLFSISDMRSEEYLNNDVISQELINIFILNNFSLSGNSTINHVSETRWYLFEKQYLFSITDEELDKDLNNIDIRMDGEIKEIRIPKLKNIFEYNGFLLSENYVVWRMPEKWNVINERENYEIWKKDGNLNVYKQEELIYEILKEDGALYVYDRKYSGDIFFKIGEKYYRISLLMAD